jgi:transposase InsO family protein
MAEASPDFLAQFEHEHDISYVEKRPPHRDGLRRFGYGYRKVAALLRQAGWSVSDGRVGGIWKREGLKVPQKQPKRGRLWLTDGSCIRLRPEHPNHVWSYDFIEDRTHEGRRFRMLNVIDEFTHECLAIRVARKLNAIEVIDVLSDLFILRGIPGHIRSDNGPEFVAKAVQDWIAVVGAKTAYIERGSPWENGYIESFNARLRDELLNGEIFYSLREAQIVIESWRRRYAASLQCRSAARLSGLQTASTGGLRSRVRRVSGCATSIGSAGHAGATASTELSFHLDHSIKAGHSALCSSRQDSLIQPTAYASTQVGLSHRHSRDTILSTAEGDASR